MAEKINLENDLIQAQITKLMAEVMKISAEAKWYPFVVLAAIVTATATATIAIIKWV